MAEKTTAALLQDRLTERGLVRVLSKQVHVLSKQGFSAEMVKELPLEDAAWQVQQFYAYRSAAVPKKVAKAKKAKKAKSAVKKTKPVSQPRYWQRVKRELHLLLCTNDQKYASIRRNLGAQEKTTQAFIASSITGAVVPFVGASAVVIGPLVTIGLIALVRVGTNAWCAGQID